MGEIYFIADPHMGHNNILKYRTNFNSITEHDNTIIENWNRVIKKKNQIVWVLGDFLIKNKHYDMPKILAQLNGTIRIIPGNHCHLDYYPRNMIWKGLEKKYGFWISHAPIHPDELRGSWNIHGHTHNRFIDDERYINVCVENINYTPISLSEIRQKIKDIKK